jgi:hypothetical protein
MQILLFKQFVDLQNWIIYRIVIIKNYDMLRMINEYHLKLLDYLHTLQVFIYIIFFTKLN